MAGFEIGSIFASLKLENKEALDTLSETVDATKVWGKKVIKETKKVTEKFDDTFNVSGAEAALNKAAATVDGWGKKVVKTTVNVADKFDQTFKVSGALGSLNKSAGQVSSWGSKIVKTTDKVSFAFNDTFDSTRAVGALTKSTKGVREWSAKAVKAAKAAKDKFENTFTGRDAQVGLSKTAKRVEEWARQVQKSAAKVKERFKGAFKLNDGPFKTSLGKIRKGFVDLKRSLGKKSQIDLINSGSVLGKLSRLQLKLRRGIKKLNKSLKIRLGLDPKKTINSFRLIGAAGKKSAKLIKKSFSGLRSVMRRLRRAVFSIQGVLFQIGAGLSGLALINRAKNVEQLGAAFDNLTRSIGGVSSSFLGKLRRATRGAVSDMELMKTANNAILLGVVKNEDQFASLAVVARRLGQAVGRDAVSAINDLTIGIGRQSRLILDNLGIIVKVDAANESYAFALGKTASELTTVERRQAFLNATMTAARLKVKELGEDLPTLAQAWGRFTATFSNTSTIIARAFVGPGGFNVISKWIEDSQAQIGAYASFIAKTVVNLFNTIIRFVKKVFTGDTFGDVTKNIADTIADVLEFSATILLKGIATIFSSLGLSILELIALLFTQIAFGLGEKIANLFNQINGWLTKAAVELLAKAPSIAKFLGLDDPELLQGTLDQIEAQTAATQARIAANAKKGAGLISAAIDISIENVTSGLAKIGEEAGEAFAAQGNSRGNAYFKLWAEVIFDVEEELRRLGLSVAAVSADSSDLTISLPLQGLANEINAISKIQAEAIKLGAIYGEEVLNEEQVKNEAEALENLKKKLIGVNELFNKIKSAPKGTKDTIIEEFVVAFEEVQDSLGKASVAQAHFTAGIAAQLKKLGIGTDAMKGMADALDDLQKEFRKTAETAEILDLALAPTFLGEEELGKLLEPLRQQAAKIDVEVKMVGLNEVEKQLNQLEISFEKIRKNELSPDQIRTIDKLQISLHNAIIEIGRLNAAEKARQAVKALDLAIESLSDKLATRGSDALGKSLLDLDRKLERVRIETGATGGALEDLEERFEILKGLTRALRLDELEEALEVARVKLEEVGATDAEKGIRKIDAVFDALSETLADQPEQLTRVKMILDELKDTEIQIRFKTEINALREDIRKASFELSNIGKGPVEKAIAELDESFRRLRKELGLNEEQAKALRLELDKLARTEVKLTIAVEVQDAKNAIKALDEEIADAFLFDEVDRNLAAVGHRFRRLKADLKASGDLTYEIEVQLEDQENSLKAKIREAAGLADFANLTREISDSVFRGIAEGFARGEKPSKIWAAISADILAKALEKTLEDLTNSITKWMGKIFEGIGASAGFVGGLGSIATGLMAAAGLVLSNLDSRSSSTIDDLDDQINSSEAIRGVVAGPSNIARTEVAEGMKGALRTTELLLERIAVSVERGGGGGGGGGSPALQNSAFTLTGSSE